ncbi:ketosynthase chain-length factor [Virgisporangium aurantiacum]|uniref:Actinorhodin polyketide putative beta-ketoacyl synthase 2 n=1 Tax=Virgisporangium aurantiacum TaxID=175570 RepID=A0A8J3ZEY4_9ACTN|nr:ketosynthase chain-length factor [Virgisporangium aurantiacum]GIJ60395.1 actinorhodin polyketide putative beta-ketoacyl synthase 2 [Virgisporangium aurantiacum]
MSPVTAVVTGVGVAAPTGLGVEAYWPATLRGELGIRRLTRFDADGYPARLAGEITGFAPADHLPGRLVPQTDRMTQFALAATDWAFADAGVRPAELDPQELGVVTASASGGFEYGQRELENLWSRGPRHVSAYMSFAWFYAVNSGQISIRHNLRGPTGVLVGEQAGGLDAIAQARRQLRKGLRLVVTGGTDGPLSPYGWVAQLCGGRLSRSDRPDRAYLPFDDQACGHVPGEGGAMLIVEDGAAARARGARRYGEIAGYGATFDPHPDSGGEPALRAAAERALADAGAGPGDIGVVFADAAGVRDQDRIEADAITAVFGPAGVPVTAPKAATGRLYAGGAVLDVVTALLALRGRTIPPTMNVAPAPDYGIDLVVDRPRPLDRPAALVLARGAGGFNAAMVLRAA